MSAYSIFVFLFKSKGCGIIVVLEMFPSNFYKLFIDHGSYIKVAKGNHVFREGERANDFFYIKSGSIQITKETENGKELTFRICGKNSIIGETNLFGPEYYHSTSAKAVLNSELYCLNKDTLEMLLTEHPNLMIEYLKWLQNENLKNQSLLRDLIMQGKKGALFSTLIRLANTYGEKLEDHKIFINLYLTNTELANLCATSREMINRMLNELKKEGIITFDKGYITILNKEYLRNQIGCDNCPIDICRID